MQERPDQSTLLDAVAQFLLAEVAPAMPDKALAFRVMIAANLAAIVSGELATLDARYQSEVRRLQAIFPDVVAGDAAERATREERREALAALNTALVERLRGGRAGAAELAHVRQTVRETVAVTNPRFDLSLEIE